jgi:hypothetical protein
MPVENLQTIKGTLYSKDVRKVPNKKTPTEPDYEFFSIKVEYKINFGGHDKSVIAELQLDRGVNFDGFSVGDSVSVDFYLFGKKISDTWFKTEAKVVHIGFADRDSTYDNHKGKIKVDAMSDINTIGEPRKETNEHREKVFVPPSPNDDDSELDGLPF